MQKLRRVSDGSLENDAGVTDASDDSDTEHVTLPGSAPLDSKSLSLLVIDYIFLSIS
jgi:hypothetical protein